MSSLISQNPLFPLKIDFFVFYSHQQSEDKRSSATETSRPSGILTRAWMLVQSFRNTLVGKIRDEGSSFRRDEMD